MKTLSEIVEKWVKAKYEYDQESARHQRDPIGGVCQAKSGVLDDCIKDVREFMGELRTEVDKIEFRTRLLKSAQIALDQSGELEISCTSKMWSSRLDQFSSEQITDKETAKWLSLQVDYWDQKDRDYGRYLRGLVATFKG